MVGTTMKGMIACSVTIPAPSASTDDNPKMPNRILRPRLRKLLISPTVYEGSMPLVDDTDNELGRSSKIGKISDFIVASATKEMRCSYSSMVRRPAAKCVPKSSMACCRSLSLIR